MSKNYAAVVIGSGQGGTPLSMAFAQAGHKTALIESTHVGGCCVNEGCTPTKTMIASGRVAYLARRGKDYGVTVGGGNEVQRTMLELITQLDGFDARGNIKVMFATNRPSTLDPALMRPGRIDRKIEFSLPDLEGRANILRIHAKSMSVERDIRWELISRLCPNATGAELRSVCTEAGMFAIRARRKVASEKDFLSAVDKVIKGNLKFNSTATYMQYN